MNSSGNRGQLAPKPQYPANQEYQDINESLLIGSACARRRMEPLDDQIQASWPGSNSVSGDRNTCNCLGRNNNQTLVAGRSPPTACCGCSQIYFCISANL
jgi:hypothetical protein